MAADPDTYTLIKHVNRLTWRMIRPQGQYMTELSDILADIGLDAATECIIDSIADIRAARVMWPYILEILRHAEDKPISVHCPNCRTKGFRISGSLRSYTENTPGVVKNRIGKLFYVCKACSCHEETTIDEHRAYLSAKKEQDAYADTLKAQIASKRNSGGVKGVAEITKAILERKNSHARK